MFSKNPEIFTRWITKQISQQIFSLIRW